MAGLVFQKGGEMRVTEGDKRPGVLKAKMQSLSWGVQALTSPLSLRVWVGLGKVRVRGEIKWDGSRPSPPYHLSNPKENRQRVPGKEAAFVRTGDLVASSAQSWEDQVIHRDKIGKQIARSCSFGLNPPRAGRTSHNCAGIQYRSVIQGPGVELAWDSSEQPLILGPLQSLPDDIVYLTSLWGESGHSA